MNCKALRTELLHAECPDRPSAAAVAHLRLCAACRQWQRRLVEIEATVSRLPVPPSSAKTAFLERFAREAEQPAPLQPLGGRLRRLLNSPALPPAALAASLLLFAFWWMGQNPHAPRSEPPAASVRKPAPDRLLAELLDWNLRLARSPSLPDKVDALARATDMFQVEARELAADASADELTALARLYQQLCDGLLENARKLPTVQRPAVLQPVAERLAQVGTDANELALDLPPESALPLLGIAAAASQGETRLRQLLAEGKP